MKARLIQVWFVFLLSAVGHACAFAAGFSLATLNASVDQVSGWKYLAAVAFPVAWSGVCMIARFLLRKKMGGAIGVLASNTQSRTLAALATHVDELAASGATAKARELLDAIDIVTGSKKS